MPEPFDDPYVDAASGLLRNRLGITDQATLDRAEADLAQARTLQFLDSGVLVARDLDGLRSIHRTLLGDVYDWAGEVRTVDLRKNSPGAGFFVPASRIESGAAFVFAELEDEESLRGFGRDRFIERLAHHYDQVNYLHPFREGNGRTQRLFWSGIARSAGWEIDWDSVSGPANDDASRRAMETASPTPLIELLDPIVGPVPPRHRNAPAPRHRARGR